MSEEQRKFITDDLEILDLFRQWNLHEEKLWIWQQKVNNKGIRPVHFSTVRKVDGIKKSVVLEPTNSSGFRFIQGEEIFLYSAKKNMAVKIKPRELEREFIIIPLPPRLNHLSQELAEKINIVEKENETAHEHERTAPRKQATDGQLISLTRGPRGQDDPGDMGMYSLYDISQGGMGFRSYDPAEFEPGDFITVTEVDGKMLTKPLIGTVVAIRQMEEEDETFKIGVKFS